VAIYGRENIDYAGEQVLGYPGTWATDNKETDKIKEYLTSKGV